MHPYLIICELCELCEQIPSVYYFRKVSMFSGKVAHSVFKEALRCFHKKFTKFTKFTHFRVRVWRGAAFQIVPDSSKWFHLRFARSSGRRRRIIVSTYFWIRHFPGFVDSCQTWMRRVTEALFPLSYNIQNSAKCRKKQFLDRFFHFFCLRICIYQKNVLPLQSQR